MRAKHRFLTVAALSMAVSTSVLLGSVSVASAAVSHRPRLSAGVPRQAGWSSSNWSGYAKHGAPSRRPLGERIVPGAARSKGSTYSSAWVGIDGFKTGARSRRGRSWTTPAAQRTTQHGGRSSGAGNRDPIDHRPPGSSYVRVNHQGFRATPE